MNRTNLENSTENGIQFPLKAVDWKCYSNEAIMIKRKWKCHIISFIHGTENKAHWTTKQRTFYCYFVLTFCLYMSFNLAFNLNNFSINSPRTMDTILTGFCLLETCEYEHMCGFCAVHKFSFTLTAVMTNLFFFFGERNSVAITHCSKSNENEENVEMINEMIVVGVVHVRPQFICLSTFPVRTNKEEREFNNGEKLQPNGLNQKSWRKCSTRRHSKRDRDKFQ